MEEKTDCEELTEVVAAVIERDGLLLVCKRAEKKRHGGLWEFPGGKLEAGESLLDAVRRELAEELGLSVSGIGKLLYSSIDPASGYMIRFVEVKASGEPALIEHADLGWLPPSKLKELPLAPSDRGFVDTLDGLS